MDATDDKLPGNPAQDPLLPDSLRQVLGFARRTAGAGAGSAYPLSPVRRSGGSSFFWQGRHQPAQPFLTGKKPQPLCGTTALGEEQRRGALLTPGEEPLAGARCTVRATRVLPKSLPRGASWTRLAKPLARAAFRHPVGCLSAMSPAFRLAISLPCRAPAGDQRRRRSGGGGDMHS